MPSTNDADDGGVQVSVSFGSVVVAIPATQLKLVPLRETLIDDGCTGELVDVTVSLNFTATAEGRLALDEITEFFAGE